MTRGKYASSADARKAREDAFARANRAEKALENVLKANEALSQRLSLQREDYEHRLASLREMLEAGTSQKVRDIEERLAHATEQISTLSIAIAFTDKRYRRAGDFLLRHYIEQHDMDPAAALELTSKVVDDRDIEVAAHGAPKAASARLTPAARRAIRVVQKAKGL